MVKWPIQFARVRVTGSNPVIRSI
ncbi:hypothetical protein HKBW3C_03198, partial [Candidatus Hakubella thermalkaliphila]